MSAHRAAPKSEPSAAELTEDPTYDDEYRDSEGRRPGEEGFVSPFTNTPLRAGCYDDGYRSQGAAARGGALFWPLLRWVIGSCFRSSP